MNLDQEPRPQEEEQEAANVFQETISSCPGANGKRVLLFISQSINQCAVLIMF